MNRDDERIIEGMRRQAILNADALTEARRLGWKAGFGTEPAMSAIGTSQPLAGFLTTSTQVDSGSRVKISGWGMPLIESEVAVRVDKELGPGTTAEKALGAIGAVAAAIELVDLGPIESLEEVLAGNIFHRHVLLGEFTELAEDELEDVRITVTANHEMAGPSNPRELIGDLPAVVAALADQADLVGDLIRPGDIVITGAAVPPAPVSTGDRYRAELNGGSSVSVELV
ncbi:MAG: fumarylacetoacetate hydrolase family protein [Solirubrobacterales bacterium]|nr:fumarylacetoacetate hydrolase family protein [Solirubrobacterales bacterium]MCB8915872.1 fumarylacetoacetate hydrolase family protein [Thermoleophilales bacterium]